MSYQIIVEPIDGGWLLTPDVGHAGVVFHSGAKAERAARLLADRLAQAGCSAVVEIRLRGGGLAGRIGYAPAQAFDLVG